jgi:hypothetical protein
VRAVDLTDLIYDLRLGYVRSESDGGFDILGAENAAENGRIVTLGGYSTIEQAKKHISWADYLHKKLGEKYQIYNGCTEGFTSAQELTMLIRDVILLKPKLVICLSGYNNFANKTGFVKEKEYAEILRTRPFTNSGQIAFTKKVVSRFGLGNDKIYYGEENNKPAWEYWLEQEEIIHSLCEEFGIRHMTFLQPCIFSGNYEPSESENARLAELYKITKKETDGYLAAIRGEYKNAQAAISGSEYIFDISEIFNGESGVYTDAYHVKEAKTEKLAEAINLRLKGAENADET